ncbi:hypothetical protein FRX31_026289 [Thalictrum thalictroides]|uniref:Uncharacterized protein n=1 Tax=Thalictrum thalictroides TaxID=46969 RepID=A0A7J6VG85_THATH|nr:hypothetical protein FRX31_026289 [Thalictrum thalictroides]
MQDYSRMEYKETIADDDYVTKPTNDYKYRGTTQAVAEGYAFVTSVLDNATLIEGDITKGTGSSLGVGTTSSNIEGHTAVAGARREIGEFGQIGSRTTQPTHKFSYNQLILNIVYEKAIQHNNFLVPSSL